MYKIISVNTYSGLIKDYWHKPTKAEAVQLLKEAIKAGWEKSLSKK